MSTTVASRGTPEAMNNQPLLGTGARRVGLLFHSFPRPAHRVAGHSASSVMSQQTLDYRSPQTGRPSSGLRRIVSRWWKWAAVAVVTAGGFGFWAFCCRHPSERFPASATDVTELTSVPPPAGATHIHVASCGEAGIAPGFQSLVRFEAPTAVCLQYAAAVLHGAPLGTPPSFAPKVDADFFTNPNWFDLNQSTNLIGGQTQSGRPLKVWVDKGRGIFYSCESD